MTRSPLRVQALAPTAGTAWPLGSRALRQRDRGAGTAPPFGSQAHRPARDRGAGTVLVIGLVATVIALMLATGLLVHVERARSGAQAAADLAALAAAAHLTGTPSGGAGACRIAHDVAARNGARVTGCVVQPGGVVRVRTARPAGVGTATASARAGPVTARGGGP